MESNLIKFINNIDYHLFLQLFDHVESSTSLDSKAMANHKLLILKNTYLFDKISATAKQAGQQVDDSVEKEYKEKLDVLKEKSDKVIKNIDKASDEERDLIFQYSKFLYENGKYAESQEVVTELIKVLKNRQLLSAHWGLLNINMLGKNIKVAREQFKTLENLISKERISDAEEMVQVNMLLNAALFLYKEDHSEETLFNTFHQYESVLAAGSIHLTRYYIAIALLISDFDVLNGSILPIIKSESYRYTDSFTTFIKALLEDFDYEQAESLISDIEALCEKDYFLSQVKGKISQAAKNLILSVYGMVHNQEDVTPFVKKLGKSEEDVKTFQHKPLDYNENESIENRLKDLQAATESITETLA